MPCAVRALVVEKITSSITQADASGIVTGEQAQDGPGSLRRCTGARCEGAVVVAGTAFTPSAIGILIRPNPFKSSLNRSFPIADSSRFQTSQSEECAVEIID